MESEVDEETVQPKQVSEINLEYRDYEDNYETITVSSSQALASGAVKGKYYKQTYRAAWEHMPDFKGWLTGVQGEPTRAYCLYCQKTLHAHRLSLLKHTCTIRHQKAAQIHNTRKNKSIMEPQITFIEGGSSNQEDADGEEEAMVEYSTVEVEEHENDIENEQEDGDDDDETVALESLPVHFQKQIRSQIVPMAMIKPPISTHVLDTSKGHPVAGLQMEVRKQDSLYPFIEIVFDCRSQSDHYHVPLLLNPYGYTTYRGS
ncbi:HIUase/Transthyretin family [Popillia japonica]|uniref:HIUase/Transthyretin family n=1 Tax=Popillia japonica TaxID=7064 RepID=A0AAW1IXV8_POPJA